jgi:hypothetical protein
MSQAETQERTTISLPKERTTSTLELRLLVIGNLAWLLGWLGIGVAFVTALTSYARIVFEAGARGSVIIMGVDFRWVLGSLFLMGFRTIIQGLIWLRRNARSLFS